MLLPIKLNPILEKQDYKKNMLVVCSTSYIEINHALLAKVGVSDLEKVIAKCNACLKLAIFLVFNK